MRQEEKIQQWVDALIMDQISYEDVAIICGTTVKLVKNVFSNTKISRFKHLRSDESTIEDYVDGCSLDLSPEQMITITPRVIELGNNKVELIYPSKLNNGI